MNKIMIFPRNGEFEKAKTKLDILNMPYKIVMPIKEYENMCVPAIVFNQETYSNLMGNQNNEFIYSGAMDYLPPKDVKNSEPESHLDDILGKTYIMVAAPCTADESKIRIIAHLSKDISYLFPYLNTHMKSASYNSDAEILTFMEQYRLISLYNNKVAIAKADDITDAWRIFGKINSLLNYVFDNKDIITPSYKARKKPPALDIIKRLPGINCGDCGQKSCMAFALSLWGGNAQPSMCKPIFGGDYTHLQDAFIEICAGLGFGNAEKVAQFGDIIGS